MKGTINLSIEVDLNQIICDDSLEALQLFTGGKNKEEVGVFYLEKLANKITSLGDFRLPYIKHEIFGDIKPSESEIEAYSMSDLVSEVEQEQPIDVPLDDEVVEIDDNIIEQRDNFVDKVISTMEDVSINKGLPKEIKVTAEIYDSLCVNEKGEGMTRIAGLPVLRDSDLEALIEVSYEPYGGGEIESHYVQTLAKLI